MTYGYVLLCFVNHWTALFLKITTSCTLYKERSIEKKTKKKCTAMLNNACCWVICLRVILFSALFFHVLYFTHFLKWPCVTLSLVIKNEKNNNGPFKNPLSNSIFKEHHAYSPSSSRGPWHLETIQNTLKHHLILSLFWTSYKPGDDPLAFQINLPRSWGSSVAEGVKVPGQYSSPYTIWHLGISLNTAWAGQRATCSHLSSF